MLCFIVMALTTVSIIVIYYNEPKRECYKYILSFLVTYKSATVKYAHRVSHVRLFIVQKHYVTNLYEPGKIVKSRNFQGTYLYSPFIFSH